MAFGDSMIGAERVVYAELVERRLRDGSKVRVPVLLPWSTITVDGTEYVEANSTGIISENGAGVSVPLYGSVARLEYGQKRAGIRSAGESPADMAIHSFGWI